MDALPRLRRTGEAPYYMMYEMYFDDMAAYQAAMKSPENLAAGQDLLSFAKDIVTLMVAETYEDEVRR